MEKYESIKLKNQLCFPLYLCSKEIIRRYTPLLNDVDLTYTQYVVMMYMWEVKKSNVKELGKTILLDSSTLTPLLKKLENKGYIKRERNEHDERNVIITLTNTGKKLKDKVIDIPKKVGKCINLNEDETKYLYNILYKILINVMEEEK
jgi:MarR family transcriptional regulator